MKKLLLTMLSALLLFTADAQFSVTPGDWTVITINSLTYRIFVPADYNSGSNYYLHVAFYGDGEQTGASLNAQVPGKFLNDAGTNWNAEITMNNSSVAKFIVFGIPNYGIQPSVYGAAIDSVFKKVGSKVDTSNHNYFSCSGFSGGPGRMWSYLCDNSLSSPYRLIFQNTISMSPTALGTDVTARSTQGRHWVWYSSEDPNTGTPAYAATNLFADIGSSEKFITNQDLVTPCHCSAIWDSCMSIAGTAVANGGTALTNRWRWLVDPNDGLTPPPSPEGAFVVGQLRKKIYSSRELLYYVPDTAQRATLKYYFLYNVLDSSGKDSAYAVQRGLAKKYKDGWNGKLPLCNGDTAIFTMVTQVENPHLKADMETGIQWALDSLPNHVFDTAAVNRMKNVFTGIGYGPNSQLTYLMNKFSILGQGSANFRQNFGAFVSLDQKDNGFLSSDGWATIGSPFKSWWWTSNTSGYPYMPSTSRIGKDSADNRNPASQTKITELAVSYSPVTWDSAYSTAGTTAANNVFRWIVDTSECISGPPPAPEGPFVVGQLRKKTYSSRELLYYVPDTAQRATLKYYFLYNVLDSSGKDSAYAVQRGLAKKYKDGWNGKLPLCSGDTAIFTMVTQVENPHLKADMETGIQWALDSLPNHVFDTAAANRMKNVFTGIGYGPNSQLTYLMNKFSILGQGSANFRQNFGVFVSLDQKDNGFISTDGWATIGSSFKSWWWTSNTSGYPYMPSTSRVSKDSADNRNPGDQTKITELALSYSPVTWDSAYSTAGTTAANNVFRWIVDTSECEGMGGKGVFTDIIAPETIETPHISISPNPATHVLNIAWSGEGEKAEILVIDMQGRIVYQQSLPSVKGSNVRQLNIYPLAKGQYLLRLSTGKNIVTHKFLKN
jgi:hypothetical protein